MDKELLQLEERMNTKIDVCTSRLDDHITETNRRVTSVQKQVESHSREDMEWHDTTRQFMSSMDSRMQKMEGSMDKMQNNHLAHIQASMATIEQSIVRNSVDLEWIKKNHWMVYSAVAAAIIMAVMGLILK